MCHCCVAEGGRLRPVAIQNAASAIYPAMPGTFESDMGGIFNPLHSVKTIFILWYFCE